MNQNKDNFIAILKDLDIFAEVDYNALSVLCGMFEEKIYTQDDIIFKENSMGDSMMVVASGKVRISQVMDSAAEEALVVLKKGEHFGEMALLEELPRSATVFAHTNAIIFEISREKFMNFLSSFPGDGIKILLKLSRELSSRLRETDNKLKAFMSMTKWL